MVLYSILHHDSAHSTSATIAFSPLVAPMYELRFLCT